MRFDVVTLFPEIFDSITKCGITARAMKRGLWSCHTWNPRAMTEDVHRTVDDRPFGGGPGMVMMADPLAKTVDMIRASGNRGRVISFAPNGTKLTDERVRRMVAEDESVVLVCGRYEGIDERFLSTYVDRGGEPWGLRSLGRRDPCMRPDGRRSATAPRRHPRISPRRTRALRLGFLTRPTIRVPKSGAAWRCPPCSFPGTTQTSAGGRAKKVCDSPCKLART